MFDYCFFNTKTTNTLSKLDYNLVGTDLVEINLVKKLDRKFIIKDLEILKYIWVLN